MQLERSRELIDEKERELKELRQQLKDSNQKRMDSLESYLNATAGKMSSESEKVIEDALRYPTEQSGRAVISLGVTPAKEISRTLTALRVVVPQLEAFQNDFKQFLVEKNRLEQENE